jgi:post-segregation antitoxin (ccd killing protein)
VKVKPRKKTVGITLPPKVFEKARKHKLNISRISEQALNSILDYLETHNNEKSLEFLSTGSFLKESVVDGTGFEPAASAMPTLRSFQADLPAQTLT